MMKEDFRLEQMLDQKQKPSVWKVVQTLVGYADGLKRRLLVGIFIAIAGVALTLSSSYLMMVTVDEVVMSAGHAGHPDSSVTPSDGTSSATPTDGSSVTHPAGHPNNAGHPPATNSQLSETAKKTLSVVILLVIGYLTVQLLVWGLGYVQSRMLSHIGHTVVSRLRMDLINRIQQFSLVFHRRLQTGDLISRAVFDAEQLRSFLSWTLMGSLADVLVLVAIITAMFLINPYLAITGIVVMPLGLLIVLGWSRSIVRNADMERKSWSALNTYLQERISSVREIQRMATEERESALFRQKNEQYMVDYKRQYFNNLVFGGAIEQLAYFGVGLLIWVGGMIMLQATDNGSNSGLLFGGARSLMPMVMMAQPVDKMMASMGHASGRELTAGALTAFLYFLFAMLAPMRDLVHRYRSFVTGIVSGQRVAAILRAPIEQDKPTDVELPPVKGEITFKDVTFAYEATRPILSNVNLNLTAGERVAIVGRTGAGKTTLSLLLTRFVEPQSGKILLDGIDISGVKRSSLRNQVAYVPQETFLFRGTVMDNIRLGHPEATDEQIQEVAAALGVHQALSRLARGYNTMLEEGGQNLSLGQRQIVALCRAMLSNPRAVILDEAAANIDPLTESVISSAMQKLTEGRTTIIIAHRLASITNVDRILVMQDGAIVEGGSHENLVKQGGVYAAMFRAQSSTAV